MMQRHLITTVLAILIALLIAHVDSKAAGASEVQDTTCYTVDVSEQAIAGDPVSEQYVDSLIASGYRGVAGDDEERLYSPSCFSQQVTTQVVTEQGVIFEPDGEVTHIGYPDGSVITVPSEMVVCYGSSGAGEFLPTDGCVGDTDTQNVR
jgi:hypothetical protein